MLQDFTCKVFAQLLLKAQCGAHKDAVARGRRKVGGALHGEPHRLARQAQLRVRQRDRLMCHAAPHRAGAIPYAKLCRRALRATASVSDPAPRAAETSEQAQGVQGNRCRAASVTRIPGTWWRPHS